MKILVTDPEQSWCNNAIEYLKDDYEVDRASTGKDAQLLIYKNKYYAIIVDLELTNHTSFEVIKYIKVTHPAAKIILTISSKQILTDFELTQNDLVELGVADIIYKPYSKDIIRRSIEGDRQFTQWQGVKISEGAKPTEELAVSARDEEFSRIRIEDFYGGNVNIFSFYIKLSPNKYVRMLHRGEFFERERLDHYRIEKKVTHLYFKTEERKSYINFVNTLLQKLLKEKRGKIEQKVNLVRSLSEKYVEEVFTSGIKPSLVEEGLKVCDNLHDVVKSDPNLYKVLREYHDLDPSTYSHSFLVAFISSIISKELEWVGRNSMQILGLGALFHDIGKLKLPPELREMQASKMNDLQRAKWNTHPTLGVEILDGQPLITGSIKQIVHQHHEYVNGEGYPRGLTGNQIYPLAKIVSLADAFVAIMMENKQTALQAMKTLLSDKKKLMRYDAKMIQALVLGFVSGDQLKLKDGE